MHCGPERLALSRRPVVRLPIGVDCTHSSCHRCPVLLLREVPGSTDRLSDEAEQIGDGRLVIHHYVEIAARDADVGVTGGITDLG